MSHSRSRSPCQRCEEMKMIPARYLTEEIRMNLSKVLDPPRVIYGSDYKAFADKNGLTPDIVEWLDSQKTQFNTSSIKAVLKYLIEKKGDSFTVYQVYRTLCQMNSSGQNAIIDGMPDIRRLYRQESRPGEEHSEPPSVNIAPQAYPNHQRFGDSPAQFIQRDRSPPPPYDNAVYPQSIHMEGGDAALALNDLNAGKQVTASSAASHRSSLPQTARSAERDRAFCPEPSDSDRQHYRHGPCENSCHPSGFPGSPRAYGHCPAGGRQAEERSFCSDSTNERNISHGTLPSYVDSQRWHSRTFDQHRMNPQSPTEMHELKLPLEGPEVSPGGFSGSVQMGPSVSGRGQDSSASALSCNRPTSFPTSRPSSYKLGHHATRPVSDSQFCSHLGACKCIVGQPTFVPPSVLSQHASDSLPLSVNHISSLDISESDSGVSAIGAPWDECRHQTEVKQPLRGPHGTNAALQQWSMPQHKDVNRPSPPRQLSLPVASSARNGLNCRFVLVVAADMDESVRLDQQVGVLCQQLSEQGIHYVVVRSTSLWPVVGLSQKLQDRLPTLKEDFRSVQDFVWGCFRRASKVLLVITPGYLRYADAFCENPGKVETYQQKLIRKIQEKLKVEFFEQKRAFRIWPVLLREMKANRAHVPSFLSSSAYYWFPYIQGAEDVIAVLRENLTSQSSNVKRSI